MKNLLLLLPLIAGAILPIQASMNAKMAKFAGGPVMAAFLSFAVGTVALFFYAVLSQPSFSGQLSQTRQAPGYVWLAGLLGVFYVVGSVYILPRLGVALTFSLLVAGQMLITLVVDHYGLMDVPVKPVNLARLIGILLIIGGVILIRRF